MKAILRCLRRIRVLMAAVFAAIGLIAAFGASPALADSTSTVSTADFCQTSNGGDCLNAWNGGSSIKMEEGGVDNEDFGLEFIPGRCGGGLVTSSCPFADTAFDSRYEGYPIVQVVYQPSHKCLGLNASLGACNSTSSGSGGADGTIFVDHGGYMINLYWSNQDQHGSSASCMNGTASNDGSINLNVDTASGCSEWGLGMSSVVSFAQAIENGYAEHGNHGWDGGDVPYGWDGGHASEPGPSPADCSAPPGDPSCNNNGQISLDCSGFSRWVYDLAFGSDVLGSGSTISQDEEMTRVGSPSPGDLVFFGPSLSSSVHVGVYIGNNQMIDEPNTGSFVRTDTVSSAFGNILGYFKH